MGRGEMAMRSDLEWTKLCVGPGWAGIVDRLITDLLELGWDGKVSQVKEKFGGLRFYICGGTEEMFDRIDRAESESLETCEECGEPGTLKDGGWLRTLCKEHRGQ